LPLSGTYAAIFHYVKEVLEMGRVSFLTVLVLALLTVPCSAGIFDGLMKDTEVPSQPKPGSAGTLDTNTTVSGLKEALSIGTKNAVGLVSQPNGYFGNQAIKILMPEKIQRVADVLKMEGYQHEVDNFILTMNRAAEKAAPRATPFFVDAVKEITFEDATKILRGGDTAATDYFKSKTFHKLYDAFKPSVSSSMDEVGAAHAYKEMVEKYTSSVPFVKEESLDLDHYVTTKALDGLFYMVGQEEKRIRTDPTAQVTDLLRRVFGK
jgi:hypothetical protein